MKKSLLALAALGAFAGGAFAQSNVTLYGRVDLSAARNFGSDATVMQNGSGSRFGVTGVEDLGGGLKAHFQVEHRFNADTGAISNPNSFWTGRSIVGLMGGFGKISLGRDYAASFLGSQLIGDPWGWDTVASTVTAGITGGGIAKVRYDNAVTYNLAAGPVSVGVQTAIDKSTIGKRPLNMSVGFGAGPVKASFAYEKPNQTSTKEKVMTANVAASFGGFTVGGHITDGKTAADAKVKAYLVWGTAKLGAGELRAGLGQRKVGGTKNISALVAGYHHSVSKRTTLYADFGRNSKLASNKSAVDFGIKHNF